MRPRLEALETPTGDESFRILFMRKIASSRVSLMSRLSRALVTMRTFWMRERTVVRPGGGQRLQPTSFST